MRQNGDAYSRFGTLLIAKAADFPHCNWLRVSANPICTCDTKPLILLAVESRRRFWRKTKNQVTYCATKVFSSYIGCGGQDLILTCDHRPCPVLY
ncbi:hypothetical protein EV291_13342 [Rhizobium sp. BK068]|nr:hypothetical protein [Rhizobium sp. BK060]TCM67635.1 hypothetical protein EV291_13342 [Rhizobium sp. BK068]